MKKLLIGFFLGVLALGLGSNLQSRQLKTAESLNNPDFSIPIIPGADGFGMDTPAGSGPNRVGGTILHVTTLAEDGPGSFREALLAKGPRTIVFDVSGYISLRSPLKIYEPYVTIAGQTAPSPGISLKGAGIVIDTHDILIQHIRVRVGDDPNGPDPKSRDGIGIVNEQDEEDVYNIVIDHVSVSWAIDENMSTAYEGVRDITVKNSIISEGLWHSIHPLGAHSKGFLVGIGTHRLSVIGNLFAHNDQRNMFTNGDTSTFFVNNLIYNWYGSGPQGGASVYGSDHGPFYASIVGNAYVRGKDTRRGNRSIPISIIKPTVNGSKVYLENNKDLEISDDPKASVLIETKYDVLAQVPPVWIPSLVIKKSEDVKNWVLSNAGARARDRDKVDLRIINDVKNGTGRVIDSQDDVGGWPPLANNIRGIGDIPVLSFPSNDIQPSGYTELEEWLHRLALQVENPK